MSKRHLTTSCQICCVHFLLLRLFFHLDTPRYSDVPYIGQVLLSVSIDPNTDCAGNRNLGAIRRVCYRLFHPPNRAFAFSGSHFVYTISSPCDSAFLVCCSAGLSPLAFPSCVRTSVRHYRCVNNIPAFLQPTIGFLKTCRCYYQNRLSNTTDLMGRLLLVGVVGLIREISRMTFSEMWCVSNASISSVNADVTKSPIFRHTSNAMSSQCVRFLPAREPASDIYASFLLIKLMTVYIYDAAKASSWQIVAVPEGCQGRVL